MAQIHRAHVETDVKCSADKFFDLFKNNTTKLPNILPQTINSIQVLEGDGKSVNSVRLWKYVIPGSSNFSTVKEKIKVVDNENRSITFKIMEGDLMNIYKSYESKLSVTPTTGNGCKVKWDLEFEKVSEDVPNPDDILDLLAFMNKEFGRYLLNN